MPEQVSSGSRHGSPRRGIARRRRRDDPAGSRSDHSMSWRAHDSDNVPPASAAAMSGWTRPGLSSGRRGRWRRGGSRGSARSATSGVTGARRRARPPPGTLNAASTWACAAACWASATARARRQLGLHARGHPAASACARYSSPARRNASASAGSAASRAGAAPGAWATVTAASALRAPSRPQAGGRPGEPVFADDRLGDRSGPRRWEAGGGASCGTPGMAQPGSVMTSLPPAARNQRATIRLHVR